MNPGQTTNERICYVAGYGQGIGDLAIYGKDHVERKLNRLRQELDQVAHSTPSLMPALHGENGPDSRDAS